jgi:mannosyltransferase
MVPARVPRQAGGPRSLLRVVCAVSKNARRWVLTGLMGLAFALRVMGLDFQSLWRDEVDAVRFASKPLSGLLHTFVEPGQNGPLYYLLLRPWLELAGDGEFALRFFSIIFGVLAVPLFYRLARRLFPRLSTIALLAALLAATSPYLIWYSQEGKMYTLVVVLVLLSMDNYLAALEQGGWHHWLVYVLVTSVAFYVHLIAALVIPAQVLVFFLQDRVVRIARWRPWLASMAALTMPYLPLLIWQAPLLLQPAQTGFRFVPLHDIFFSLAVNYSLGVIQGPTVWFLALFVALLLAAGLLGWGHGFPRASLAILACWLLVPVLSFFLITLNHPLYTARYLIFVLPAYLLLLASGMVAVAQRSRLLAGLLLVAVLMVSGRSVWLQARVPLKADFRAATRYLTDRWEFDDLVLFQIPYGRYSFEYYLSVQPTVADALQFERGEDYCIFLPSVVGGNKGNYRWADGLYTNTGMTPAVVDRHMTKVVAGSRVVWLVATEVPLWDEQDLVRGWLEDHAMLTEEAQFVRVTVYRYELP